jgi:predicted dinucleotide-binding enzyme
MKVTVLGCGRMGIALGSALSRTGDEVLFASRNPERVTAMLRQKKVRGASSPLERAGIDADLIVLATAWHDTRAVLAAAAPADGKVVLSVVNPETDDSPLVVGHTTSAAEEIAGLMPGARVVEAFNGTYAEAIDLAPQPTFQTVLYCGDDPVARQLVASVIRRLGFDALDAGPLRNARYLEPLAALTVYLVRTAGYGPLGINVILRRGDAEGSRST